MDLELKGKKALVLGSSAGMGRAIATGLAAEGADVMITGRNQARVAEVAAECGSSAFAIGDLTEEGVAERFVSEALSHLGGLDILIGNTGGGTTGGISHVSMEDVQRGYESMLRPQLAAAKAAIPALRENGQGRMIFLTARSVLEASPELALSSVFRSGVAAAARSMAIELAPHVTVNVVVPGQVDTGALERFEKAHAALEGLDEDEVRLSHLKAIPMGRLGTAEEIANVILFLASARASYVTGATIRVDGGLSRAF